MKIFETKHDFTTSLRKALDDIDAKWESYTGLIVPGSHTPHQVEEKIKAIQHARENEIPALLICFGHQLAAIEYARNIMGIRDATSEEFGTPGTMVVKKGMNLRVGEFDGESYWNNYYVTIPWTKPPYFFTTQAHPEYQSSKKKPHPLLVSFIDLCRSAA